MPLPATASPVAEDSPLLQGDVFSDIQCFSLFEVDNEQVEIKEYLYPQAIIISQACDTHWMSKLYESKQGKITKYMPMILLCPVFHSEALRNGTFIHNIAVEDDLTIDVSTDHLYSSDEKKIAGRDFHYRFHKFDVTLNQKPISENYVVDFKQCFSVPFSYLYSKRNSRLFRLDLPYAQQITMKFGNYISRMGFDNGP